MNTNPFTPNFGQIPMYIVGRDEIISEIEYAFEGGMGNPALTSIFTGARGSGKTALLTYISTEISKQGWIVVNTTCTKGIQEDILEKALKESEHIIPKENKSHMTGVSIGQLISVEWEKTDSIRQNWRSKITRILEALNDQGIGLLITIDEVNPKLDEMIQIASVYQLLLREGRKLSLLMAGLPSNVSSLLNHKSVSFLRRATQFSLENISDHEIKKALQKTIEKAGKSITIDALDEAAKAIGGFAYMLQLVGYRAWQESEDKDIIGISEMRKGIDSARSDFEVRVLRASVDELSKIDLKFLMCMIEDNRESNVSDIESRMGKTSGFVARYRLRLIESGLIEPAGRGRVRFALPGLREYLIKTFGE